MNKRLMIGFVMMVVSLVIGAVAICWGYLPVWVQGVLLIIASVCFVVGITLIFNEGYDRWGIKG